MQLGSRVRKREGGLQGWGRAGGQSCWMDVALEGKDRDEGGRVMAHGTEEKR